LCEPARFAVADTSKVDVAPALTVTDDRPPRLPATMTLFVASCRVRPTGMSAVVVSVRVVPVTIEVLLMTCSTIGSAAPPLADGWSRRSSDTGYS
jgi:hypothetical protein